MAAFSTLKSQRRTFQDHAGDGTDNGADVEEVYRQTAGVSIIAGF